jgi:cytochrome d ubiquinol oxidase subunit II
METVWFAIIAFMLAAYVVLDGFDLGAGVVHLWVARTDAERGTVVKSIGPVWDGNEVWLIAVGGALFCAFPRLYAESFSGFYLPLMIVLYLLMGRGIALEFRKHVEGPVWKPFWDVVFSVSSALLTIFLGAALGNVVRGVPMDAEGRFFGPLWTDFRPGRESGILDWYTVLVGLLSCAALSMHGALWIALKTEGELQARARRASGLLWIATAALTALVTFFSFRVQPHLWERLSGAPWGGIFAVAALAGLGGARGFGARGRDLPAFLASCAFLAGMIASVSFTMWPYVLPACTEPSRGLTVWNAAAEPRALRTGLAWMVPGLVLVTAAFSFLYRHFAGKVPNPSAPAALTPSDAGPGPSRGPSAG